MKRKRVLSLLMVFALFISAIISSPLTAEAATKQLTKREKLIIKAYVKSAEKENLKYINKYKYPGLTYNPIDYDDDIDVKLLLPTYFKKYDSNKKLYYLCAKGILVVSSEDLENIAMQEITIAIYIKVKDNVTYAYLEKLIPVSGSLEDNLLSIDDLTDNQFASLESYLTTMYGEETASSMLYD